MAPREDVDHTVIFHDDVAQANKIGVAVEEVAATRISEADMMRKSAEALTLKSKTGLYIFGYMLVMGCNQAGFGIDWGVISGINSNDRWHDFYGFGNAGVIISTINALMQIGGFLGAPFLSCADVLGRRGVNFLGNALVIIAAIMQAMAPNLACLFIGRLVLGFGTALCTAPQYVAELAPVHLRGRLVGVFGACFQVGSLMMIGIMMGLTNWDSDWQWRMAFFIQAIFPLFVCVTIYFLCPESPRFLYMRGKKEEARRVVARYMTTDNDINHEIVDLMILQIEESIETTKAGFRATWDFRVFFTKAVWFRTVVLAVYAVFQQWNGGGIIGYYLAPALDTIGITTQLDQLGISLGSTAIYFVFTLFGSYIIDYFRRRTLIFAGLISMICAQIAVTITSWQYNLSEQKTTAILTVVWIYLFQVCSATFIATMHNLYPVELLSLPLRAKGMGLFAMFQAIAAVVHNYGIGIGVGKVGYKIWAVYIVYNFIQIIISYYVFPETSKLNLEEIDTIFETPGGKPVKLSIKIADAKREKAKLDRQNGVSQL
ncbi:sugar transporter [Colletotrichum scovillei]|uniref:Sugar transporter n=3 Tax=Colletotrichum acutatum species complex TaxID=2707335 RepID=A0A9P7UEP7_9PEZI|nr:sugar transporter [Colletotrichum scovillei]KAG7071375.1 sugar transporter [Colletotrichum scovillei]KAG7079596.1 sugar transporter [Colletotrichum scovillei]KXH49283.1 sugar transporter [Colletotrichum nymphaeae SA-01]